MIDYPGKIAAVVFTQGCNFRCPYCHNPELVLPERFSQPIEEKEVFNFLNKRKGQIQGVVITGGEPTLQGDLIDFLARIKEMGYCVKLDTNGSNPEILRKIIDLHLVDYIAMDIKAPLGKYSQLTSLKDCPERVRQSIDIILRSQVSHEFRTTLAPPIVSQEDLPQIVSFIKDAQKFRLQKFVLRDNVLDKELMEKFRESISDKEIARLQSLWGRDSG